MVDQARSPFGGEQVSDGRKRLLKGSGQLMLGLSDLRVWAEPPSAKRSIRRVAENHIKAGRRQQPFSLTEVALHDLDAVLQPIESCTPSGPVGQGGLDLKSDDTDTWMPMSQQEGDGAVCAAEIKDPVARSRCGPLRQQQRIHRMAKARQAPDDLQT